MNRTKSSWWIGMLFLFLMGNGLAEADDASKRAAAIRVDHEWDRLDEVILGSTKDLRVPGYCPGITFGFDYQAGNEEWIRKYGGRKMAEADPEFYKRMIAQVRNLVKILESRGITVHRHDPALLTPEELAFMSEMEKGYNFLYPRDPVIVIGNHVIETALKLPMRTREKFIVRRLFGNLLGYNPNVQYVAVPSVSPSFPEKGGLYLEGGDVMLNGKEIYVGHSGNASSEAGIEWFRRYLGDEYTVHQINITGFQHLDCVLSLVRPGLAIWCPRAFTGDLPDSLKDFDFIEVPLDDAKKLACNVLVLDQGTVIIDERFPYLKDALEKRGIDVIPVPFDAVTEMGGGFRCFHHPIRRVSSPIN